MSIDLGAARRAFGTYQGVPLGARAFVLARYLVAPMGPIAEEFHGLEGSVLSLGSGLMMLERYLAELEPGLTIEGVDVDATKVALVERTRHRSPRVSLTHADATKPADASGHDVVLVCDAMHHFTAESHIDVLRSVADALRPGGIAVVKDLDVAPRWKFHWNRIHDRIVAGPEPIHCRTPAEMGRLLEEVGLVVERSDRIDHRLTPYAHYLVRARKPG